MRVTALPTDAGAQPSHQVVLTSGDTLSLDATWISRDGLASLGGRRGLTSLDADAKATAVQLDGCPNAGYTASATVGGGAKVSGMHLLVDTALCDAVLASTACTSCHVSPMYNATLGRAEDVTLHGQALGGNWTGLEAVDQIDLGSGAFSSLSLAGMQQQSGLFHNKLFGNERVSHAHGAVG